MSKLSTIFMTLAVAAVHAAGKTHASANAILKHAIDGSNCDELSIPQDEYEKFWSALGWHMAYFDAGACSQKYNVTDRMDNPFKDYPDVTLATKGIGGAPPSPAAAAADDSLPVLDAELVARVNGSPQTTWTAGLNVRFSNFTVADARRFLNARSGGIASLPSIAHDPGTLAAAPQEFDPRVSREACTGPVLDQAFCGSCWAFGAVEAISDRLCMSKGAGAQYLQLSSLDMTSCDSGFFSLNNGCQGGQTGSAWNYAKKTGLVTEKCFPYLKTSGGPVPTCAPEDEPCLPESKFIKTPKCTKECADGSDWESSKHKLDSVYNVPSSQLMAELATNGPVESAFTVYADFVHYKSGVYEHTTGSMLGGHAVKIIGYGTESGTDYWLVQNSWTTSWGDGGFFKIKRGSSGLDSGAVAGSF